LGKPKKQNRKPCTYVLGDLHGAYLALCEVLNRVQFDYEKDKLIFIGDLADGWGEFHKCLNVFAKMKYFIPILGNHDLYLQDYLKNGTPKKEWLRCGGGITLQTIKQNPSCIPLLVDYLNSVEPYYILDDMFFCHGGFNHKRTITNQKKLTFSINRQMYKTAKKYQKQNLKFKIKYDYLNSIELNEIFIGHSTTRNFKPEFHSNLINIDTGAGSVGCLTIMNVYNKKFIQSTNVKKLYKPSKK